MVHFWPIEISFDESGRLGDAEVSGYLGVMCLVEYVLSEWCDVWNTQSFLKVIQLIFLNDVWDVLYFFVVDITLDDLFKEGLISGYLDVCEVCLSREGIGDDVGLAWLVDDIEVVGL